MFIVKIENLLLGQESSITFIQKNSRKNGISRQQKRKRGQDFD